MPDRAPPRLLRRHGARDLGEQVHPARLRAADHAPDDIRAAPTPGPEALITQALAGMDRRTRIAQLFVAGVRLDNLAAELVGTGVGGIFLAGRSQVAALRQGALPPAEPPGPADRLGASLSSAGVNLDLAPVAYVVPAGSEQANPRSASSTGSTAARPTRSWRRPAR